MKSYKPKYQVLQEFTQILYEHNPMQLPLKSMGQAGLDEYESEALSILSRFNESVLHMCEDPQLRVQITEVIVKHALEFWFNETPANDISELTASLLNMYINS